MDIQLETTLLRGRLEADGMSERQIQTVTAAIRSAFAFQAQKYEHREAEIKRLDRSVTELQCDIHRLDAQLWFARRMAQAAVIGLTGLFLLLMYRL
jgi:hypothetical protein